jgi:hypothetical protein
MYIVIAPDSFVNADGQPKQRAVTDRRKKRGIRETGEANGEQGKVHDACFQRRQSPGINHGELVSQSQVTGSSPFCIGKSILLLRIGQMK